MPAKLCCEPLEDRATPAANGPDPAFGSRGTVVLDNGYFAPIRVAVLPDGRYAVGGSLAGKFAVTVLRPDGRPDPAFGVDGETLVPFDTGGDNLEAGLTDLAVQPDGKIVLAGAVVVRYYADTPVTSRPIRDFAAARLLPTGALDPTFGTGGKVTVGFDRGADLDYDDDVAFAVAVQPDGRIVLAGGANGPPPAGQDFAAVRLLPDGSLDPSFGTGGKATVSAQTAGYDPQTGRLAVGRQDSASAVAVQPDGRIVMVGTADTPTASPDPSPVRAVAVRLLPAGRPDPGFGSGGVATAAGDYGKALAVQPDGKIVTVGSTYDNGRTGSVPVVGRLNADGSADGSFANPFAADPADPLRYTGTSASDVTVLSDGRILLAGRGRGQLSFQAVRLLPSGRPDPRFGVGGTVVVPFAAFFAGANSLAPLPGGGVVMAGGVFAHLTFHTGVVRLLPDPPPPPVLAGGRPDGTAVPLPPSGGQLAVGPPAAFFPGFAGVVRAAAADVTGDGVADSVGGAGPCGGPRVAVLDGATGATVASFFAFEPGFTGGVFVAAADLDGDGKAEIIVTPDRGGGPIVAVFRADGTEVARFFGIDDPSFRGGARPAAGDVNGDGTPDLVVSAGFLGGPRIALFDGRGVAAGSARPPKLVPDFFAFEDSLRNGAFVAAGDLTGDGKAELIFGGGPGGGPRVRVFDGAAVLAAGPFQTLDQVAGSAGRADFFAGDSGLRGGVRVATRDTDGDGTADLVTGSGDGEPGRVRVYKAATVLTGAPSAPDQELAPFGDAVLASGVFVG